MSIAAADPQQQQAEYEGETEIMLVIHARCLKGTKEKSQDERIMQRQRRDTEKRQRTMQKNV